MTDSQKFEAYGRAMADLKQAKFDLAAAQQRLSEVIESLKNTTAAIEHFAKNPRARAHDNRPLADLGYAWQNDLRKDDVADAVHDVFTLANKVEKLKAQVESFDK